MLFGFKRKTAYGVRFSYWSSDVCSSDLKLPLGAMIEVPAAAINVRALLEHADFLAIGTNDLAQYVLAADRGNDALENIYNPLQPALLRLISPVLSARRRAQQDRNSVV